MSNARTKPSSGETTPKRKPGRVGQTPARSLEAFLRGVRDAAEFAKSFQTELRKEYPRGLNSRSLFRTAQAAFEIDVARRGDLKNHIVLRRLRQADRAQDENNRQRERAIEQRERQLELAREKFEFHAAEIVLDYLPELRRIADDRSMHRPDKIQAVRRRLFGEPPPPATPAGFIDPAPPSAPEALEPALSALDLAR